jgi:hypothetical protein
MTLSAAATPQLKPQRLNGAGVFAFYHESGRLFIEPTSRLFIKLGCI